MASGLLLPGAVVVPVVAVVCEDAAVAEVDAVLAGVDAVLAAVVVVVVVVIAVVVVVVVVAGSGFVGFVGFGGFGGCITVVAVVDDTVEDTAGVSAEAAAVVSVVTEVCAAVDVSAAVVVSSVGCSPNIVSPNRSHKESAETVGITAEICVRASVAAANAAANLRIRFVIALISFCKSTIHNYRSYTIAEAVHSAKLLVLPIFYHESRTMSTVLAKKAPENPSFFFCALCRIINDLYYTNRILQIYRFVIFAKKAERSRYLSA